MFEELTPPYSTIVADPPWRYGGLGRRSSARDLYSTLTIDDICALPVGDLAAPSAHLWLWAVNNLMEDAYRIVRAWGFNPITLATWCKSGPGVGYYLRNNTEHLILATRGKPVVPATPALGSWFQWPRGGHSVKPGGALDMIEQVSPGPYVELFARQPRLGWDAWGYGVERP